MPEKKSCGVRYSLYPRVWPVFVAMPLKMFLFKNKTYRKMYRTQPAKLSFLFKVRQYFFSLNSCLSLAQNLASWLLAMTNGRAIGVSVSNGTGQCNFSGQRDRQNYSRDKVEII